MSSLKTTMRALLIGAVLVPAIGLADDGPKRNPPGDHRGERGGRRSVPEFDPATIGAVAALVAGGGILVARRRRR